MKSLECGGIGRWLSVCFKECVSNQRTKCLSSRLSDDIMMMLLASLFSLPRGAAVQEGAPPPLVVLPRQLLCLEEEFRDVCLLLMGLRREGQKRGSQGMVVRCVYRTWK